MLQVYKKTKKTNNILRLYPKIISSLQKKEYGPKILS